MLKMKAVVGPTLDNYGQFEVPFGEVGFIESENFDALITGTATGGTPTIPITNTSGFAVGQVIEIQDSGNREVATISAITPGVSLTTLANLVSTYTVARGGKISILKYGAPRVAVFMGNPFTDLLTFGWRALGRNLVRVYGTLSAGFTQGELMTGTALATGRVVAQGAGYVDIFPLTGTFLTSDTITGGTSGSTVTAITLINTAGPATVLVTVEQCHVDAGPDLEWTIATTANVAGMLFTVIVDGQ